LVGHLRANKKGDTVRPNQDPGWLICIPFFGLALIFALTPMVARASDNQPPAAAQTKANGGMSAKELNRPAR